MNYTFLTEDFSFPDYTLADKSGLLALGGDLHPDRLRIAYQKGIFPWYNAGEIIQWWFPNPRFVLFPDDVQVSTSMRKLFEKEAFQVTYNQSFREVITQCAQNKRKGQSGTWITKEMIKSYTLLHELGHAKSIEVWQDNELVGGLYGVEVGTVFCGESMFSLVSNASKYGFISMVQSSHYQLIDCQLHTQHLESLGAKHIEASAFLSYLPE